MQLNEGVNCDGLEITYTDDHRIVIVIQRGRDDRAG